MDQPDTHDESGDPGQDEHTLTPVVTASRRQVKTSDEPKQKADYRAKASKYRKHVMRVLVAIWRFLAMIVGFLDKYDGAITALATLAIVVLTFNYVRYSKHQWEVMQSQKTTMDGQLVVMQGQLQQMQLQLPELQKSATAAQESAALAKHSVIGAEAAIVQGGIAAGSDGLVLSLANSGKAIATKIEGILTISRKNLNTRKLLEKPKTVTITIPQIRGQDSHGNFGFDTRALDPNFRDLTPITQLKETVIVEGTITFNDGFDDIIPVKICQQLLANINGSTGDYVGYVPQDCASAETWIANLKFQAAKAKSQPK